MWASAVLEKPQNQLCPSSPSLAVQMNNRFTPCRAADWPWREEASEAVLMFHSKSWEPGRRGIREFKPPNQDCLLFHQVLFSWAASQIFSHAGFRLRAVLLPLWGVFVEGKFNSFSSLCFFSSIVCLFSPALLTVSAMTHAAQEMERWGNCAVPPSSSLFLSQVFTAASRPVKIPFYFLTKHSRSESWKISALKCYLKDMWANWMWYSNQWRSVVGCMAARTTSCIWEICKSLDSSSIELPKL